MTGDPIGFAIDGHPPARARMRNVDQLPREFRSLVHHYGYAVWRAYLRGWSPEQIAAAATPDGCFEMGRPTKRNAMGIPRTLFARDARRALAPGAESGDGGDVG